MTLYVIIQLGAKNPKSKTDMAEENVSRETINDSIAEFTMDEQAQIRLLETAEMVRVGSVISLVIDGNVWKIRTTSQAQNKMMSELDYKIYFWQKQLKEATTAKDAIRLNGKIRKAYAKKAAYKVLGKKLRWIPFAHAYMWRRIYHSSEKVSATINATEMIGENKSFYLANLGSSKQALALSMIQVGNAIEQRIKRGESAESMAQKDALPKKEDSK